MASLYQIEQELQELFNIIEDNDGEVTDEQYEALIVTKDNLYQKLGDYYKAICIWENNAISCKNEKKRINDTQKKYENRVAKLKEAILQAVVHFGDEGKTNKVIELPTVKFFTRKSTAIKEEEHRINVFLNEVRRYVHELSSQGILYTGDDVDLEGLLSAINANLRAEDVTGTWEDITMDDLNSLVVDVKTTMTVAELFKKGSNALEQLGTDFYHTTIVPSTDNATWKTSIAQYDNITLAYKVVNTNLQIK